MKKNNSVLIIVLIIVAVIGLSYSSYRLGKTVSDSELGPLMMVMNIDSTFVTTGIYEEMPNNVKRTIQFYIEDTPTVVNDVKLFAEVKYATVNGKEVSFDNGKIWNLIKEERIFQRQFEGKKKNKKEKKIEQKKKAVPKSNITEIYKK